MHIEIRDAWGRETLASWDEESFSGLSFTNEMPGGHITASFLVKCEYHLPYEWANHFLQVDIFNGPTPCWSGYVMPLERYWDATDTGILVECAGWAAKLQQLYGQVNLSAEKGSTYITDHILTDEEVSNWIQAGNIQTTDYTIPGVREYKPWKTYAEMLEDINQFNGWYWYVRGKALYWEPPSGEVAYRGTVEFATGSARSDPTEFANRLRYDYTDTDGVRQTATLTADSPYPVKDAPFSLSGNMTAAQALAAAQVRLDSLSFIGTTAPCEIWYCETPQGMSIPACEIWPGLGIRIDGFIPATASAAQAFQIDNDIDTYTIRAMTYNHETGRAALELGRQSHSMPVILNRLAAMAR